METKEYTIMLNSYDIGTIFNLVRKHQRKYTATEACYEEVLEEFVKLKTGKNGQ